MNKQMEALAGPNRLELFFAARWALASSARFETRFRLRD